MSSGNVARKSTTKIADKPNKKNIWIYEFNYWKVDE